MSYADLYKSNSDFVNASNLGSIPVNARIITSAPQTFKDGSTKAVLEIATKEDNKMFVLNKTNYLILTSTLGDDPDLWVGQAITLGLTQVNFNGRMVNSVRIFVNTHDKIFNENAAPF